GTSATAMGSSECGSVGNPPYTSPPPFSAMPYLIQGHDYLLLISHFSGSGQSGYQLSFSGGTASITDTKQPLVSSANAVCLSVIGVRLNKKMSCSSLTASGSEFNISPLPPGVAIVSAVGDSCSSGFDMDSLTLTLNADLTPGNYTLTAVNGTDGNTILDNCGTPIPAGQSVNFAAIPPKPTPLGAVLAPGCAPTVLKIAFNGPSPIQCSSIAADGSDFSVSGGVQVTAASGICDANGLTDTVLVQLSAPIQKGGNYQLWLQTGSDGNTLVNFCGLPTPQGFAMFSTMDTVSAKAFVGQIHYGCVQDTIAFTYPSENQVSQWQWTFNGTDTSGLQNPSQRIYPDSGSETVSLAVSNGVCSDSTSAVFVLDNAIHAKFEAPNVLCPKDYATILDMSSGPTINSWSWDFGDGTTNGEETPPDHLFPQTGLETSYTISLVVANALGCKDTASQKIDVLRSCYIAVPGAFTPNGDGVNDYLYPLNALNAENLDFKVFDRWGQLVFETRNWMKKWDGTVDGHPQPAGTYVWMLSYVDKETGKRIFQKGTSLLIR
ncbi:MAG TPA: gliding motility-associated C-terminal domain-containing protein, partial [Puia sp.]|nr:gliding motility-associated C-terminal domain-containing protein [Puia sp.]